MLKLTSLHHLLLDNEVFCLFVFFLVCIKQPMKQKKKCTFDEKIQLCMEEKEPAARLLQCRPPQCEQCQTFASYPTPPHPQFIPPIEAQSIKKITLKADRHLMLGTSVAWQEIVSALCFETAVLRREFIADTSEWHHWHHWRTCAHCIRETNFDSIIGCRGMKASSD